MSSKKTKLNVSLETKYKIVQMLGKKTAKQIVEEFKSELRDVYTISKN